MVTKSCSLRAELNEGKASGRGRLRQSLGWTMIGGVAGLMILGGYMESYAGPPASERQRPEVVQYAKYFSISKAEGRDSDQVQVTYAKEECSLSGVHCVVAFHYQSGATPAVVASWPTWRTGETKIFTNINAHSGPVLKIEFWERQGRSPPRTGRGS